MKFSLIRLKKIKEIEFSCEIVTPLFLGGANSNKAELREASIKGMLRFWWRALYGDEDYKSMRKRESEIFGSTESKSRVEISVENEQLQINKGLSAKRKEDSSISYLFYSVVMINKEKQFLMLAETLILKSNFS